MNIDNSPVSFGPIYFFQISVVSICLFTIYQIVSDRHYRQQTSWGKTFLPLFLVANVMAELHMLTIDYLYIDFSIALIPNSIALMIVPTAYLFVVNRRTMVSTKPEIFLHYSLFFGSILLVLILGLFAPGARTLFYLATIMLFVFNFQNLWYFVLSWQFLTNTKDDNVCSIVLLASMLIAQFYGLIMAFASTDLKSAYSHFFSNFFICLGLSTIVISSICLQSLRRTFANKRNSKPVLSKEKMEEYIFRMNEVVNSEKLFINPTLKITDIAEILGIPSKYLSLSINQLLNKNFNEYISTYRVAYFKQLMTERKYRNYTLMALAEDSGFRSASTFNTAFKRETGRLPSHYRKKVFRGS